MSDKFQPINRYTTYLLPPSLQDWLSEKHQARFVVDIVDQLDLSRLVNHYSGGVKAPYHPALLLGLLFYGYATGVFSSRKLEQATHDSVSFRFITVDTHPDHDTIATIRQRLLPELEGLFVQMLVVAKERCLRDCRWQKSTVETVFGIVKEVMGFRRIHLRGLAAA